MFTVENLGNIKNITKKIKIMWFHLVAFFLWAKSMFFKVGQRYQNHLELIFKNVDSWAPLETYKSRISEGLIYNHPLQHAALSTVELIRWNHTPPQTQILQDFCKCPLETFNKMSILFFQGIQNGT